MNKKRKAVFISEVAHALLVKIARKNKRTLAAQVEYLLAKAK